MPNRGKRELQPRFFTLNFSSDKEMTAALNHKQ
jgi:hypothetical protein